TDPTSLIGLTSRIGDIMGTMGRAVATVIMEREAVTTIMGRAVAMGIMEREAVTAIMGRAVATETTEGDGRTAVGRFKEMGTATATMVEALRQDDASQLLTETAPHPYPSQAGRGGHQRRGIPLCVRLDARRASR